jgi:(p)ppGpp synthase/HD superfamily hydrolase
MSCRTRRAQPPDRPMHPPAPPAPPGSEAADFGGPESVPARTDMASVRTESPELSFIRDLPLSKAALEFARARHAGQTRGSDHAEFVLHPVEVASSLERSHYPDYVVAAAILHDVLEDTDAERCDIEARFGPEVAELVATLSDDPSIGDEERRREDLRERVREAGGFASVIFAADKVSKVRELRALLASGPPTAETEAKLRHYQASLEMLEEVMPGSHLVELLRFELEALEQMPPRLRNER